MPVTWPSVRTVLSTAEATPSRFLGAEPMMALLLGELKMAMPIGTGSMRSTKPNGVPSTRRVAIDQIPRQDEAQPDEADPPRAHAVGERAGRRLHERHDQRYDGHQQPNGLQWHVQHQLQIERQQQDDAGEGDKDQRPCEQVQAELHLAKKRQVEHGKAHMHFDPGKEPRWQARPPQTVPPPGPRRTRSLAPW